MSALGQKLPRDLTRGAAALPPIAAAALADRRVRYGPTTDIRGRRLSLSRPRAGAFCCVQKVGDEPR
jgi:hypothetical protein